MDSGWTMVTAMPSRPSPLLLHPMRLAWHGLAWSKGRQSKYHREARECVENSPQIRHEGPRLLKDNYKQHQEKKKK